MKKALRADFDEIMAALGRGEQLAVYSLDRDGRPTKRISVLEATEKKDGETRENETVRKAKEYIEENYYKAIKVSDVARYCDVSVSHLSRLFAATEHTTMTGYVLAVRMNNAAYMLVNGDRNVVDIASEVGCPDCGYFHKIFRKYFGVTPLQYRKLF